MYISFVPSAEKRQCHQHILPLSSLHLLSLADSKAGSSVEASEEAASDFSLGVATEPGEGGGYRGGRTIGPFGVQGVRDPFGVLAAGDGAGGEMGASPDIAAGQTRYTVQTVQVSPKDTPSLIAW